MDDILLEILENGLSYHIPSYTTFADCFSSDNFWTELFLQRARFNHFDKDEEDTQDIEDEHHEEDNQDDKDKDKKEDKEEEDINEEDIHKEGSWG